jgi:hypothetical protein
VKRIVLAAALAVLSLLALPLSASAITVSQNSSNEILPGNSLSCPGNSVGQTTAETGYWRVFDLSDTGTTSFTTASVTFGIQTADDAAGDGQPLEIRLYALDGAFTLENLTLLATEPITVQDSESHHLRTVPITATIPDPASTQLVAEVFAPDGSELVNFFEIGSNDDAETAPSYITAPDCDVDEPETTADIASDGGFDDTMNIVLFVDGGQTPVTPPPSGSNPGGHGPGTGSGPGSGGGGGRKCKKHKHHGRASVAKKKHCKKKKKK